MRRRLLQQDRGNTAEADHAQIVNTSLITEEELTHAPGVIPVQEGCLTVAATGHGAVLGLQSVTSPVILIHAPVHTALVESTMDIATEGKNSIGVIHAVQCPLDVDM